MKLFSKIMPKRKKKKKLRQKRGIFKFNNGLPVILCSGCGIIIKRHKDFSKEDVIDMLELKSRFSAPRYCDKCKALHF